MNGRERMSLAMQHKKPDRVPVMCQLSFGHYLLNTGLPPHILWCTCEGWAEALVSMQRRYQFDGILINLPGRPEGMLDDVVSIEEGRDGERVTWRNGDVTFFPWDDNPHHIPADPSTPTRANMQTIDPDDMDGIDDLPGYVWFTHWVPRVEGKTEKGPGGRLPEYFLRTIDLVRAEVREEVAVHGEVFSPFTHFMELFGYEQALIGLATDPSKCHAVLERLSEPAVHWAVMQAQRGVDAIDMASPFAGAPFISPGMYREFVVPYERKVTDAVRACGVPIYTHTCGFLNDRLELMVETGTMGIDTLDPPPLGDVELSDAKRRIGGTLFIKGNMNPVAILAYTTKEEVLAEASERIRVGKPGGGYILSTACSVAPRVEPWKLELLVPLAEEIGRYD
jgi:uroporphyrinogen decarboxylase